MKLPSSVYLPDVTPKWKHKQTSVSHSCADSASHPTSSKTIGGDVCCTGGGGGDARSSSQGRCGAVQPVELPGERGRLHLSVCAILFLALTAAL